MEKSTEVVYQNSSTISAWTKVREGWEILEKGTLVQITKWYLKQLYTEKLVYDLLHLTFDRNR